MIGKISLLLATIAVLLTALAAPLLYQQSFDRKHAEIFDRIPVGSSRQDLLHMAGSPSYITDGTRWVEPEYEKSPAQLVPGCVEEYWYDSGIPFIPSRWAYCFDERGVLLDKYHWQLW